MIRTFKTTDDRPAILEVDWEAIEFVTDVGIGSEFKHFVETSGRVIGFDGPSPFSPAELRQLLQEHATWVLPDGVKLDSDYAPYRLELGNILRNLHGEDVDVGTIIDPDAGEPISYQDGIGGLQAAAKKLAAQREQWIDGGSPTVERGSFGPDQLGNLYIQAEHTEPDPLVGLNLTGIQSIGRENLITNHPLGADKATYDVIFRHSRYYNR